MESVETRQSGPISSLFITGTDTEVGKTWVTAGLVAALRERGFACGAWKPVQSGANLNDTAADSHFLGKWGGLNDRPEEIATYTFSAPLAPLLAAEQENTEIHIESLLAAQDKLLEKHEMLLVEGAGGLAVPLTSEMLIADLAAMLGLPLLIIAKSGLGTVNHTLQTIAYARQKGIRVLGVIFNGYPLDDLQRIHSDPSIPTNSALLARFTDVPILGRVPIISELKDRRHFIEIIEENVQLDELIKLLRGDR